MLDHLTLDTYCRDLERRRLAEAAADSLADLAAAGQPSTRARVAALLRAVAARLDPDAGSITAAPGRLALE